MILGEAIAAAQHAEDVVIGVVFHHQEDDMLDIRHSIGSSGQIRVWESPWLAQLITSECPQRSSDSFIGLTGRDMESGSCHLAGDSDSTEKC